MGDAAAATGGGGGLGEVEEMQELEEGGEGLHAVCGLVQLEFVKGGVVGRQVLPQGGGAEVDLGVGLAGCVLMEEVFQRAQDTVTAGVGGR